jgi:general L-amino acid transport system permease protein
MTTHRFSLAALFWQILLVVALIGVGAGFTHEALVNLARHSIGTGFGFLRQQASFDIGESLIPYAPSDSYARAFLVGLLNTMLVSGVGIVAATVLGTLIGVARLSTNWLLSRLALLYVGVMRNTPLLLQLFGWYALLSDTAPPPRAAWALLPGIFVSNRGVTLPVPLADRSHVWILAGLALGILAAVVRRRQAGPSFRRASALVLLPPILVWLGFGAPFRLDWPSLQGFNFTGGLALTPEFAALVAGLTLYTAAYIAEIVRSGILGVERGQIEAALTLGLKPWSILRLVVLPQALRLVMPPMTGQYLNLLKNSSLAIAIGYPDLVAIANTQINQTGQAIEGVSLIMAAYLVLSLAVALAMGLTEQRSWDTVR